MDSPSGSVPARIDSTMSGARLFRERILVTYDGLWPIFSARSVTLPASPLMSISVHCRDFWIARRSDVCFSRSAPGARITKCRCPSIRFESTFMVSLMVTMLCHSGSLQSGGTSGVVVRCIQKHAFERKQAVYSLWVQYPDPWVGFEKLLKYAILQEKRRH